MKIDEVLTKDWTKFGNIEIETAKELLSHIKEIDCYGKVEVWFNLYSGNVFLCDEDYNVWMMNGEIIDQWFSCPQCGHEGFKENMSHNLDNSDCVKYLEEIGVIQEEEKKED